MPTLRAKASSARTVLAKRSSSKKATVTRKKVVSKPRILGKVVHYYGKLGVAIVKLGGAINVGDVVCFRRGDRAFLQAVVSMQVDHLPVSKAKKGEIIGIRVQEKVPVGTVLVPG
jgi:hypothetical protein